MARRTKEQVLEEFRCGSIQDAAMSVIARKGVADATMQEIADEAGVAKGTLYVYFRDRDELLTKTATHAYDRLVEDLDAAFTSPGTIEQKLIAVVLRQFQFFDQNRELFRAYLALSAHLRKPRAESYGTYLHRLEQLLTEARDRREVRNLDPHEVAPVVADCIRGAIVRRIEEKSKTGREEEAAFIVSILFSGIRRDP